MRDSKDPSGPAPTFFPRACSPGAWNGFLTGIRNGETGSAAEHRLRRQGPRDRSPSYSREPILGSYSQCQGSKGLT
ncbi:DUF397 domain-containing protein [Streptosporangium sp. LJ11]|uniref:DUF397 domain-containing protein n=1 Tax=Streptosporangium sp. LJ11 TaxID=3436927 RepID=UPI003F79F802